MLEPSDTKKTPNSPFGASTAQYDSPEWLSWKHAIEFVEDKNLQFDKFLALPTTAPLRNKMDVQSCLDLLDSHTDVVVTITESHRSPFFNMVTIKKDGYLNVVGDLTKDFVIKWKEVN